MIDRSEASPSADPSITIITPSFRGDLEAFVRLSESFDRFASEEFVHLAIVPNGDLALFEQASAPRTQFLTYDKLMPSRFLRVPKVLNPLRSGRDIWLSPRLRLPVRGWIMQQILKLAAARSAGTELIAFLDSDGFFLRPFSAADFYLDGLPRLYAKYGQVTDLALYETWYDVSARLLGVNRADFAGDNYVGDVVVWTRSNVEGLIRHLEQRYNRPWWVTLGNTLHFSEYLLYGIYVDHVLKEKAGQSPTEEPICLIAWYHDLHRQEERDAFVAMVEPRHVAVIVQSTDRLPAEVRDELITALQDQAALQTQDRADPGTPPRGN